MCIKQRGKWTGSARECQHDAKAGACSRHEPAGGPAANQDRYEKHTQEKTSRNVCENYCKVWNRRRWERIEVHGA
jgi:hypothetical protein